MDRVGIALLGAGAIAEAHAAAIGKTTTASLVAVCDPDLQRASKLAAAHGSPPIVANLKELLQYDSVEGVVIATPNHLHAPQALQCAAAGRHVLCEKPLANSLQDARAIQQAFEARGLVLGTGFNQRFLNHVRLAKQAIESGVVGEIHAFRTVFSGKWDNYYDATNFRFNPEHSGGTTINDNLIHRYDMVRHLLDDEFAAVVAELTHSVIPPVVDDNVQMLVRMRRGARGTFAADRFSPVVADSTELYGTQGSIHFVTNAVSPFHAAPLAIFTLLAQHEVPIELLNAQFPQARARRVPGWSGWMTFWPQFNDTYAAQLTEFANAIRGHANAGVAATGYDGVRSTELIQGAYTSKIESRWVDLPLPSDACYRIPSYDTETP